MPHVSWISDYVLLMRVRTGTAIGKRGLYYSGKVSKLVSCKVVGLKGG